MNEPPALLDVAQVARWLNLGESTVRDLAARRKMPAYRIFGQWRFDEAEVREWLTARHSTPRVEAGGASRRARQRAATAHPRTTIPVLPDQRQPSATPQTGRRFPVEAQP